MVTRALPQPAWSLVLPKLPSRAPLPRRAQAPDDRGAVVAAAHVLVYALDGQPSSREAWILQVAAGIDEAARMLAADAPAAPCARRAPGVLLMVGQGHTYMRLLRDVRALQVLLVDPSLCAGVSTGGIRRRVVRLAEALARYASDLRTERPGAS